MRLVSLLLLVWPSLVDAAPQDAVIRVPSHGSSATVIWTGQGRSLILGCAHAFRRSQKPITVDAPSPAPGYPQPGGLRLLAMDERADLSLVELGAGPLPYVAPVATVARSTARLLSVGYDEMRTPAVVQRATILRVDGLTTWTREPPWHGRSGGALLDAGTGEVVGVVSGYTTPAGRPDKGIYASHAAILAFLTRHGWRTTTTTRRPWVSEEITRPWSNQK